ncbi:SDR family oxidoreductase [Pseudoalteromonas mariniglutinosa]|uniref:SDR family oxidoreductase n=1 Tax=Pseudoalteromonas mariniglutinosa TaxID=206042 RepID=UPI00384D941B
MAHNILITGSQGYIGQRLMVALKDKHTVVGVDIVAAQDCDYSYHQMDIRSVKLVDVMREYDITHVVHLASVMQPSKNRARDYDIDINGTKNVLQACVHTGVQHITVTSSGAAYGYHSDNPAWLSEHHPLRGNREFAYSHHKRLIEELLKQYQTQQPQLQQLILRPGTVLGKTTHNQITALFNQARVIAIKGSDSPFVFIWDEDVLAIILKGVTENRVGQFNLAGDGALTITELASALNKPLLTLPAWLVKGALFVARRLGLSQYGPEQVNFLRFRPVLCNEALKTQFGYQPQKSSREVFDYYLQHNQERLNHDA